MKILKMEPLWLVLILFMSNTATAEWTSYFEVDHEVLNSEVPEEIHGTWDITPNHSSSEIPDSDKSFKFYYDSSEKKQVLRVTTKGVVNDFGVSMYRLENEKVGFRALLCATPLNTEFLDGMFKLTGTSQVWMSIRLAGDTLIVYPLAINGSYASNFSSTDISQVTLQKGGFGGDHILDLVVFRMSFDDFVSYYKDNASKFRNADLTISNFTRSQSIETPCVECQ